MNNDIKTLRQAIRDHARCNAGTGFNYTVGFKGEKYTTPKLALWDAPVESLAELVVFGACEKTNNCVRSGGKAPVDTKAEKIKHCADRVTAVFDAIRTGTLTTRIPDDVAEAIAIVKEAGFKVDARNTRTWSALEAWHKAAKPSRNGKAVTMAAIRKAVDKRIEARQALKGINPFA